MMEWNFLTIVRSLFMILLELAIKRSEHLCACLVLGILDDTTWVDLG
jgi:hypothetical protein